MLSKSWAQTIIGFWILISPWLLGFSDIVIMKWSNVLCGLAIVIVNGWALFGAYAKEKNKKVVQ